MNRDSFLRYEDEGRKVIEALRERLPNVTKGIRFTDLYDFWERYSESQSAQFLSVETVIDATQEELDTIKSEIHDYCFLLQALNCGRM